MINLNMPEYYSRRAPEYDSFYDEPELQAELKELKSLMAVLLKDRDVFEIGCGTGYWTQYIARSARSIQATDVNRSMLDLAAARDYGSCPVDFEICDAYRLYWSHPNYNGGFAGFIWSHVPVSRRTEILNSLHTVLNESARVVWMDQNYVEGYSTAISRRDGEGNSYQLRRLHDGSIYEIIKNFPDENELKQTFGPYAADWQLRRFKYFWHLSYSLIKNNQSRTDPYSVQT
jgi:demethylmenaquinone methyltransferase/2-methoxy-6-polyprenyl-1,4-benzoquinol methylase